MTETLDRQMLKRMVQSIADTHEYELDCDQCFQELDRFAEAKLAGKPLDEALQLVQDHLEICKACHEEYEALMNALHALV
jgi:hypothetical protein